MPLGEGSIRFLGRPLGADTDEVLRQLGRDADEITRLHDKQIV